MPLLTLLFSLLCLPLFAVTYEPDAIQQALANADLVADIEIKAIDVETDPSTYARRLARAEIIRKVRGDYDDRELTVESRGGEHDGVGVIYSDDVRLYAKRRYRVHLRRLPTGYFAVAGGESGVQALDGSRNYSRNRIDGSNGDGTGAYLFWDDRMLPISYFISAPSFARFPNFVRAIDLSFQEWAQHQNSKVDFLPMGCTSNLKNENDGVNSIILVKSGWDFDTAAIAITRNFYVAGTTPDAGMILDSDILLNGVNHSFTTTDEVGKHDVRNIVTHEIGHFIGLGHEVAPIDSEATMFAVASPNETKKRSLAASDLQGMLSAYAGVLTKQPAAATESCEVYAGGGSCLAVHEGEPFPSGNLPFILLSWLIVLASLIAARYWWRNDETTR